MVFMMEDKSGVTLLLQAIGQGDPQATSQLLAVVYDELRRLARSQMANERPDHTLEATALVHEAYLRLMGNASLRYDGRAHFFSAAAEAMRRILIDHARQKHAQKRGGQAQRMELDSEFLHIVAPCHDVDDLLALNEALDRFAAQHPTETEVVKLIYFAGLSFDEVAAALGVSRSAAYRQWQFARAWLLVAMGEKSENS
jgi:RNA polymerase sigma factor (TIGR02999 family)